jgi:hypothetical protein
MPAFPRARRVPPSQPSLRTGEGATPRLSADAPIAPEPFAKGQGVGDWGSPRPLQIQPQQPLQNRLLRHPPRLIIPPPVRHSNRLVEPVVEVLEPGRALVVEVGQRPLLQVGLGRARRIEPGPPPLIQLFRRRRDLLHQRIVDRFRTRRPGKGKRLEAGRRGICGIVSNPMTRPLDQ